jgi:hypothetical protein
MGWYLATASFKRMGKCMIKMIRSAGRRLGIMEELLSFLWEQKLW